MTTVSMGVSPHTDMNMYHMMMYHYIHIHTHIPVIISIGWTMMVSSLVARKGKWGTVGVSVGTDGPSGRGAGATGVLTVRVSVLITLLFGKNCHRVKIRRG